jgi:hypothetical protein
MTNLIDTKAQLSNNPIDHYIMDHTFRPTSEQIELIEYTRSLPGRILFFYCLFYVILNFHLNLIRKICFNDWFS